MADNGPLRLGLRLAPPADPDEIFSDGEPRSDPFRGLPGRVLGALWASSTCFFLPLLFLEKGTLARALPGTPGRNELIYRGMD